jgi:predicted Zn-dependent protease with MMP-like domain
VNGFAPSLEDIAALAREAMARIPDPFATYLGDVLLFVEDWPAVSLLDELGIEDGYDLTGVYEGRPIGEKSIDASGTMPDRITLFRRPLLDEWAATGVDLAALINHVVIHEVGHHFGLSDADMHAMEQGLK